MRGFTLIEMLIIIAMIGILAGIVLGATSRAKIQIEEMESMTYCEGLNHKLSKTNDRFTRDSLLKEKKLAYEIGECKQY